MMLRKMMLGLMVALIGGVAGCASKAQLPTGIWHGSIKKINTEIALSLEFFKDKSVVLIMGGFVTPAGTWAILDDGRVKVNGGIHYRELCDPMPAPGNSDTVLFGEIKKRTLVFDCGENRRVTLTKISN